MTYEQFIESESYRLLTESALTAKPGALIAEYENDLGAVIVKEVNF